MSGPADGFRVMLGTLTVLPVRPPAPDRLTAAWAMALAPLGGLVLACLVAVPAGLVAGLMGGVSPPLLAALGVSALALLTRALHLDGLADTADGLGCGREAAEALEVMRRSDVGPFGVVALVLTLMVQVAALTECFTAGHGPAALAVGLVVSRAVLVLLATPGWPAARADGLGVRYAGTLRPVTAAGVLLAAFALVIGIGALTAGTAPLALLPPWALAQPLSLLPAWALARRCRRRLGGLTGDVYGACVEVAFTGSLVLSAVVG